MDVQGTVDDLPVEFIRVKREADVSAIKTALKDGQSLSFARLGERQNLQIK